MYVVIEQETPPSSSLLSEHYNPSSCSNPEVVAQVPLVSNAVESCGQHACPSCGKQYRSASYLRAHELSHAGLKPLLCDICGQGFYGAVNLKRHRQLRHLDDGCTAQRHICDRCGKGFVAAARLRRHISEMHDSSVRSRHSCSICRATFANAGNLQRHKRLHSNEPRPHVCEQCGKCFTQKTSLQAHSRLHNEEARQRAVCMCPVCGKQLSKSTNLRKHLLLHAPRPPPIQPLSASAHYPKAYPEFQNGEG